MQAGAAQNDIARFFWKLDDLERHVAVDTCPLYKMPHPLFGPPQSENNCWNQGTSAAKARFIFLLLKNLVCAEFIDGLIFCGPPQLRHRPSLLSEHFHQPVTTRDGQRPPLSARIAPTGRSVTRGTSMVNVNQLSLTGMSQHRGGRALPGPTGIRPCWEVFSPPRVSRLYSALHRNSNSTPTGATAAHDSK